MISKSHKYFMNYFPHPDQCAVVISLLFYFLGCERGNGRMCSCLFVQKHDCMCFFQINFPLLTTVLLWYKGSILLLKLFWPTLRKKCSSDQEKLLKFEITRTIYSNSERSELELVSKELNHLAAILHVYAVSLIFMK